MALARSSSSRTGTLETSYWPATDDQPLRHVTLGDALRDAAEKVPERLALVEGNRDVGRSWTYEQLLDVSLRTARALLARFRPGERVGFWAPNVPDWIPTLYGCAFAGITLVTVNPAYKRREMEYVLSKSRAAGVVHAGAYRGFDMAAAIAEAAPNLPGLREVIPVSDVEAFLDEGSPSASLPPVSPDDPSVIMFTSGTTGAQKGVIFNHVGVANMTNFTQRRGGLKEGGVFVNPMPMFHIGSLGHAGIGSVMLNATHVLMPEWDAENYMAQVERHGGTFSLLVSTMIEQLLVHPARSSYDLSTLRNLTSGASVVEARLIRSTREQLGATISNIYGQTEMQGSVTGTCPDDCEEDLAATIGRPLPHMEVRIADPASGATVPLGEQGEIQTRGYQNMIGYFDMPDETARAILPDGWLRSGDLGSMDERGFLKITGRIKDMIIRGGENIYPREIELVLLEEKRLADVAVVGVPDPQWGEQVGAVLQPKDASDIPDIGELFARCRSELAHYKAPRLWFVMENLPRTETGKLQKFKLVDAICAGALLPYART
ncbi:class I adenylate-forming enzyme family protein [Mesorhizobium sp. L-8-3]|uniref:class I adenylate-forming enzyme family protein n=1 Tax=Mesorhizobium sp. L-8-3 TaxID=2744522 RepID=UPI001938EF8D|nr:AMP-binding protein [Mesorhizobium sp. L-8-3]BCH23477.1 AMP-binding protein [Mesorhizobium sp. L-8-3]